MGGATPSGGDAGRAGDTGGVGGGNGGNGGNGTGGVSGAGGDAGGSSGVGGASGAAGTGAPGGSDGSGGTGGATSGTGGLSGTSGAGEAGAAAGGASGAGGTSGAAGIGDCIDFSRLETGSRDLRVIGTGFDDSDGDTVRLVVTEGEPSNDPAYGIAETLVREGSFELALPDGVGIYWGIGVYIDRGKDNACTLDDDPFWQMTTGATSDAVTFEITPIPGMHDPPCNINGILDLARTLPCAN